MIIRNGTSLPEAWVAPTLMDLIEGIYDQFPSQARLLLRKRILLNQAPSLFDRALIQVCAKRFEVVETFPHTDEMIVHPVQSPPRDESDPVRGLPIQAWLLDSNLKPIARAKNTHAKIKTRHAELNLLWEMRTKGKKIPAHSVLLSSLKPCAMCSALIWEMAEDLESLKVVYLENDPGPWGQNTILTEGSPARTRFLEKNSPKSKLKVQFSAHELSREFFLSLLASDREIHEFAQKLGITDA